MKTLNIPDLRIGEIYDKKYINAEIHYESINKMASFFGEHVAVHRHDAFFQLHFITKGKVRVFLDDVQFNCTAPAFFLTPPSVPHTFMTDPDCEGHVLTIQQSLIWPLLQVHLKIQHLNPICIQHSQLQQPQHQYSLMQIQDYLDKIKQEFASTQEFRDFALKNLLNLIFIHIVQLSHLNQFFQKNISSDLHVFRKFNELIEQHFTEHWSLTHYAEILAVTEMRLNEICRRIANTSSKKIIHDRLMQEAKRLLIFTDIPINHICYQLGFKDPAYFSRFFQRHAGVRPSELRQTHEVPQEP